MISPTYRRQIPLASLWCVDRKRQEQIDPGGEETGALGPRDGDSRGRESNGTVRVGKAKQRCQSRGAVSLKAQSIRGGFGCLGLRTGWSR